MNVSTFSGHNSTPVFPEILMLPRENFTLAIEKRSISGL